MKEYTPGLLVHRCSNAMRQGKPIKVHQKTAGNKRFCPNCGEFKASVVMTKTNLDKVFVRKITQAQQAHKEALAKRE